MKRGTVTEISTFPALPPPSCDPTTTRICPLSSYPWGPLHVIVRRPPRRHHAIKHTALLKGAVVSTNTYLPPSPRPEEPPANASGLRSYGVRRTMYTRRRAAVAMDWRLTFTFRTCGIPWVNGSRGGEFDSSDEAPLRKNPKSIIKITNNLFYQVLMLSTPCQSSEASPIDLMQI
ncbi:hypothetical protein LX36DRAFT_191460 [Colletotrichum falcatum]|nr:hypothetical protein LX36DRAFT_191460 [Colletotrichum falcatum]